MRTLVRAFPFLLLAALPALADPLTFRNVRVPAGADAASAKAAATALPVAPAAPPVAGKAACELVADPANTTHWLAAQALDQWLPCEAGQAIEVRYLVNSVADAAQAHFCAPQQPVARRATAGTELGRLRCSYAGQDLAVGRKTGGWDYKPLSAAVPHRLASLSEPIVGPARAASAPMAEAAGAGAERPTVPAKASQSAKASRAAKAASAASAAPPVKAAQPARPARPAKSASAASAP